MAHKKQDSVKASQVKEALLSDEDFLRRVVQTTLQEVLEQEMNEALGARKGERTDGRLGYRSGHYGRSLTTRAGTLELRVPQDRAGRFSTELFERYQRSEKALAVALADMYVYREERTESEGGDGGVVRTRVFGRRRERGDGQTGRGAEGVCGAALGRGLPVSDPGRAV